MVNSLELISTLVNFNESKGLFFIEESNYLCDVSCLQLNLLLHRELVNSLGDPVLLEEFLDVLGLVFELHAGLMSVVGALELIECPKLLSFETNVLVTF